jgi:hypothetical protein
MGVKRRKSITDYSRSTKEKGSGGKFLLLASVLLVTVIVGGGILILIYQGVSRSVFFQVDKVDITGCQRLNTREVLSWSGLDIKTNLWALRTAKLKKHLEKNNWIESATVKRKWPNALHIRIRERVPLAIVNQGSRLAYVDKKGVIICPVVHTDSLDYPIITGREKNKKNQEQQGIEWLQDALGFIRYAGGGNPVLPRQNISEIHVGPDGQLTLYLADNPFPIYLGQGGMKKKYSRLSKVLSWLYRKKELASTTSIDLNYLSGLGNGEKESVNRVLVSFNK